MPTNIHLGVLQVQAEDNLTTSNNEKNKQNICPTNHAARCISQNTPWRNAGPDEAEEPASSVTRFAPKTNESKNNPGGVSAAEHIDRPTITAHHLYKQTGSP